MREGWKESKVGDVVEKIETVDPRKSPDAEFSYIDVSSVSRKLLKVTEPCKLIGRDAPSRARRLVRSGDVIIATIRPGLKRVAEIPEDLEGAVCSTGFFVARVFQEVNGRFLFYWFLSDGFSLPVLRLQRGAAYPAVSDSDVRRQTVWVPPLSEQMRIVAILDDAFEGIDTVVANTEKNLVNAREVFESYRDDAFSAQAENWHSVELGELCTIKHGFAFKSEFFTTEGDYIVLTPGSFWEHGGFRDQGKKTKYYEGEIPDGYLLEKGNFLFAMTEQAAGLLGSSLVVPESNRYLHNQRLGLVQPKDGVEWHNDFFFHQCNTPKFRSAVQTTASGAKVRHTSPKKLCAITVVYPPSQEEQANVAYKLNELWEEMQRLELIYQQKLTALAELKQSLLQKAFSGELTSKKAEAAVEEATA